MKTQNTTTGAANTTAARPSDKHIYRASIDGKVVGHFTSMSAAMKVLTARAVKDARGCSGYVDVYDPDDTIMPSKGAEDDGYKCMRHRVVDGGVGNSGWFWND
jgi:hypothetical protein